ncbi:SpdD-like protein [Streptomyces sp. WAC05292]|uniref:SpdD-like protein n=1 Tax=Streptomyces sp. WAC05292 TaxID=2487418 RepID=UPI000F7421BA|nr:SpdD-like protein [Streptomyces sp. WAC05292]RSS85595.1 SpdD-like protein [Streptomyces sp. WAC05292]
MFRPHIPVNPLPTGIVTPLTHTGPTSRVETRHESAPVAAAPTVPARPTVQLTPGSVLALAAGGGAVVLVVGAVLVSMLLATAITGVSVAVIAVVLRLLIKDLHKH